MSRSLVGGCGLVLVTVVLAGCGSGPKHTSTATTQTTTIAASHRVPAVALVAAQVEQGMNDLQSNVVTAGIGAGLFAKDLAFERGDLLQSQHDLAKLHAAAARSVCTNAAAVEGDAKQTDADLGVLRGDRQNFDYDAGQVEVAVAKLQSNDSKLRSSVGDAAYPPAPSAKDVAATITKASSTLAGYRSTAVSALATASKLLDQADALAREASAACASHGGGAATGSSAGLSG
ncbi:MAG: hypothetical protein JO186_05200 [Actinobacteria bacterium]|nr:hypothetical protein [Actinomycetota bacterium]